MVVVGALGREASWCGEDVHKHGEEGIQERFVGQKCAHSQPSCSGHTSPGDSAGPALERHASVDQVPDNGSQHTEPLGAEDDVVPGQGHDEEIRREGSTGDEQERVADDARAGDLLAIGYHGRETGSVAERQIGTSRCLLGDEVVGVARVEERDKRSGPRFTWSCMVSAMDTPATACIEKQGASLSPTSAASWCRQSAHCRWRRSACKTCCGHECFSSQLKHRPRRRHSACSTVERRRWLPSRRP